MGTRVRRRRRRNPLKTADAEMLMVAGLALVGFYVVYKIFQTGSNTANWFNQGLQSFEQQLDPYDTAVFGAPGTPVGQ